nr:cell adhesion molecule 3-like isoform X2 [Crassostrea gigas]
MPISSNSIGPLLTSLVFITSISSLTLKTKDVIFEDGDSIILNCTYYKSYTEDIANRYIQWQKLIGNVFKNIALFSPPGGPWPFIPYEMKPFYNNRIELIAPNISLSAVMIIKDPICSDQGVYRCWIEYYSGNSVNVQTSDSVVKLKSNPKEPEKFQLFPNKLDENQSISILCSANVGSPLGNIKIWKISQYTDTPVLIHESKATANKPENCTEFLDDNFTYSVTRDDNGALFRCSSQNNLTQGPGPYRDSLKISVIYGPDKPVITLTPLKSLYFNGDYLTIQCITDSNPPPVFTWKFQPHNKSLETVIKKSPDISKLVFDTLKTTDSGTYSCMATNAARLNSANATSSVSIYCLTRRRGVPGTRRNCQHARIFSITISPSGNWCIYNVTISPTGNWGIHIVTISPPGNWGLYIVTISPARNWGIYIVTI